MMTNKPVDENIDILISELSHALGRKDDVLAFVAKVRASTRPDKSSWTSYLLDSLEDFVGEDGEEFARIAQETPLLDSDEPQYKWDAELGDFVEVKRDQKV